jgi:hypothetical protein
MQWTKWLLIILLVVASAGCARRDWVSDLLVLTDVTGTWEGSVTVRIHGRGPTTSNVPIWLALQQSGPKVTGELRWLLGQETVAYPYRHGRVEGLVSGEVLTLSEGIRADLAVDGDEMWGTAADSQLFAANVVCQPCFFRVRRKSSRVPSLSESPARQGP